MGRVVMPNRKRKALCLASLVSITSACGSSSDAVIEPDGGSDAATSSEDASDGERSDASTPVGLSTCALSGTRFACEGAFERSSTDAALLRDSGGHISGVRGLLKGSVQFPFWFERVAGSGGQGFDEARAYDIGSSGNTIEFFSCASGTEKECHDGTLATGRAEAWSAYAGTLVVDEVTPVFRARFTLRSLKAGLASSNGDGISGQAIGCIAVEN